MSGRSRLSEAFTGGAPRDPVAVDDRKSDKENAERPSWSHAALLYRPSIDIRGSRGTRDFPFAAFIAKYAGLGLIPPGARLSPYRRSVPVGLVAFWVGHLLTAGGGCSMSRCGCAGLLLA